MNKVIITLNGIPGSGKSTVGRKIAESLGYEFISMGQIRRKMAADMGITLAELNKLGETDPSTDTKVDEYQSKLGEEQDDFIADGKTSWHFIPHSLKIFLTADYETCATRIMGDTRKTEKFSSLEEAIQSIKDRMASDNRRYKKYYGIEDTYDHSHYDYVVDTSHLDATQVVDEVMGIIQKEMDKRAGILEGN